MEKLFLRNAGNYTLATFEYTGLYTYSIIMRTAIALKNKSIEVYNPVLNSITYLCKNIKEKTKKRFQCKYKKIYQEKIIVFEDKFIKIEQKLNEIEKKGITVQPPKDVSIKNKKEIKQGMRMILRSIVNENKELRGI